MLASEMITKFQNMVEDELDSDFEYQLLNDAMNEIESSRPWEMLKKKTSFTGTSTTLPTRFLQDVSLVESGSTTTYFKIPFEQQDIYTSGGFQFYIDLANDTLHLTDTTVSRTMNLYYTQYSADLTASDTWVFPAWAHKIIPLVMAKLYYAADAGEKARAWDDRWTLYQNQMMDRLETWDDRLKSGSRRQRGVPYNPKGINSNY